MLKLIQNELIKIFKTRSVMVPFILSFAIIFAVAVLVKNMAGDQGGISNGALDFANSNMGGGGMGQVLMLIFVVYSGQMVSKEYSYGTIKFLLTRTHSRAKILCAKYIALLIFGLILILFSMLASILIGYMFFGNDASFVVEYLKNDVTVKENIFSLLAKNSLYSFVEMMSYGTLAFMISVFIKSGAVAVGVPIFLALFGPTVVFLLSKYEWVKYILFANTSLYGYQAGTPMVEGMTFSFSLITLLIYYTVFLGIAFIGFLKRDIA